MRLDKFIADTGIASRKEIARAARQGLVTLDGKAVRDVSVHIDESTARVTYCGSAVEWRRYAYIMLNKPSGYISSTEKSARTVMTLLPAEYTKMEMFPCGRLDIDTVGLLIITNDGPLAHKLLSPKHHAEKTYFFRCEPPMKQESVPVLEAGVDIGGYMTKPCKLSLDEGGSSGHITLTEGKFHQIKRMLEAVGSNITYLRRVEFGGLCLEEGLAEGEWRELSEDEINTLRRCAGDI